MAPLSPDQVRHIAKLARLRLSEEELSRYAEELTKILGYVEMLGEVDTSQAAGAIQVTGLSNSLRPDELRSTQVDTDALLATSPLPVVERQIQTPSAHGN